MRSKAKLAISRIYGLTAAAVPWQGLAAIMALTYAAVYLPWGFSTINQKLLPSNDFRAFWMGTNLVAVDPSCLYCQQAQVSTELRLGLISSAHNWSPYFNPPLVAELMRPLLSVGWFWAGLIFDASMLAFSIAALFLVYRWLPETWPRRQKGIAITVGVLAIAVANINQSQWGGLELLSIAGSLYMLRANRNVVAGLVLSICLIKPQLCWLVLPALLLGRHYRVAAGFLAGAMLWAVSSLAIVGIHGALQYQSVTRELVSQTEDSFGIPSLVANLSGNETLALVCSAVLFALAIVALVWMRSHLKISGDVAVALGIAASFSCSPHIFSWDSVVLTLPVLLLMRGRWQYGLAVAVLLDVTALSGQGTGRLLFAFVTPVIFVAMALFLWRGALAVRPAQARRAAEVSA